MSNPSIAIQPARATKGEVVLVSLATFLVFFQGFMVAPLLPELADFFHTSVRRMSFIEPVYLLGYGLFTLVYAPLSDRYGRFAIIAFSLSLFVVFTFSTAWVANAHQMILLRLLTGISAAGIAPTTISWISDRFPYKERGYALGVFFGCMAGGTALGSSTGALLAGVVGWRVLFVVVAFAGCMVLLLNVYYRRRIFLQVPRLSQQTSLVATFREILSTSRARGTYFFVFENGLFHSGVFAWLGVYFYHYFHLNEREIGLALLGYGIPGLLLGSVLGRMADRIGRKKVIPAGILLGGCVVIALSCIPPLFIACVLVTLLSFSFDLTHPSLAVIVTSFNSKNAGGSTGLFAFFLFAGYGFGSLLFSLLVSAGFVETLRVFGVMAVLASLAARMFFKNEH
ncbi:Predicted arabinose efflux permease, MFS family [Filimonas lacunae]|uniref:Predicted arabinose efflux permease, MFS family n=1 Tax=Filimonas lacunae TaxID=477680 RepID=A0A173ML82_9BACT|nr:MFS transporter [Filimonas lacunae]BAV08364.1 major facilitator superfamily MFS_1 [Filimonas lacunae]SIT33460.1 Predicted arabinose efflux permease, MFS family [Filimonas lacunae]